MSEFEQIINSRLEEGAVDRKWHDDDVLVRRASLGQGFSPVFDAEEYSCDDLQGTSRENAKPSTSVEVDLCRSNVHPSLSAADLPSRNFFKSRRLRGGR